MDPNEFDERLSRISTLWGQLRDAHEAPTQQRELAQRDILRRYSVAIYRYLVRAVGNLAVAEDLCQEFAVRFLEGRFRNADPGRGRFRDYLKTALFHLVDDYRKREARQPRAEELAHEPAEQSPEETFDSSWRHVLLDRAWKALELWQLESGTPYYDALRLRASAPELHGQEIAARLAERVGRSLSESHVRKLVERARKFFAHRVLEEVHRSLGVCSRDQLEQELAELHLLKYCAGALPRHPGEPAT